MDKFVETTGKTAEEAIEAALLELDVDREDCDIEIFDEKSKGFLGLGGKMVKVRVTLKETDADKAVDFLLDILDKMELNAGVEFFYEDGTLKIEINGEDLGVLIGRRGETLDALQYLVSLVYNKDREDYVRVQIDTGNYRQKREEILVKLAQRIAGKVQKYKKSITLEPMNPYERRIIHASLQNYQDIQTYSIGEEPNRKVVVAYK
jgi:spoIIIJ-associated protein